MKTQLGSCVCSSVDRAPDSGSGCAGSTPVRRGQDRVLAPSLNTVVLLYDIHGSIRYEGNPVFPRNKAPACLRGVRPVEGGMNLHNFREWLSDNLRYILLAFAMLLVLVGMFFGIRTVSSVVRKGKETELSMDSAVVSAPETVAAAAQKKNSGGIEEHGTLVVNAEADVTELIQSYYTAISNHDATAAAAVADVLPEDMKQEIENSSTTYTNIKVYTKNGFTPDSYVVYTTYDYQEEGSEELMPGISQSYVEEGEDGTKKLVFSTLDTSTSEYVKEVAEDEDVQELTRQVQDEYETARKASAEEESDSVLQASSSDNREADNGVTDSAAADNGDAEDDDIKEITDAPQAESEKISADDSDESESEEEENQVDKFSSENETEDNNADGETESEEVFTEEETGVSSGEEAEAEEAENEEVESETAEIAEQESEEEEEEPYQSWEGVIMGSGEVYFRSSSEYGRNILGTLEEGTDVTVLNEDGGWYCILADGTEGYVGKKFVGTPDEYTGPEYSDEDEEGYEDHEYSYREEETEPEPWNGTITSTVNIRSGPGFDCDVIGEYSGGTSVTVYYEDSGWYYVSGAGMEGFVGHSYVE